MQLGRCGLASQFHSSYSNVACNFGHFDWWFFIIHVLCNFFLFVARRHSKEEQGSRVAAPPTLLTARPHFPFCPRTTSSSLSSSSSLFFFFLTTIIPENHHFRFFSAPWLSRTITSSLSSSSPVLTLSPSYRFSFFVFYINKKKHGLISHSFEDSLRAIEVVFVLGIFTHLSPLSIVLL